MYRALHPDHRTGADPAAVAAASSGRLRRLRASFAAWRLRRVERRCMAGLDDRMGADIGRPHRPPLPRAVRLDRDT